MPKYFNVIPSEGNTACVLLYGDIGDEWDGCDARSVTLELLELQQTYDQIDVRINSYGGDVYAGLAIFNALQSSSANIHIYVDGVAASMAAVIALCGKPVQMSQYASLMLHSASTYIYGNRQEMSEAIKQLEVLDKTLAGIVSSRLGMKQEEVLAKYFDGKDHWIDAEDALKDGLVDALYDVEGVNAKATSSHHSTYMMFNDRLAQQQRKPQNQAPKQMSKVIVTALSGIKALASCIDDESARAKIEEIAAQAEQATSLEQENTQLKQELEELKKKDREREDNEIKETLDEAQSAGLIEESERADVEALLRSNPTAARKMLDKLNQKRPTKRVSDYLGGEDNPPKKRLKTWADRMDEIAHKK